MPDYKSEFPFSGRVEWIGLRPGRREPMQSIDSVQVDLEQGLVGDRFAGPAGAPRQVTLIQQEHLAIVAAWLQRPEVDPALTRRNIVVSGVNLVALKGRVIQIGSAQLKITGPCAPCERMEENLGPGGYNAMRGHGGVTASVLQPGTIKVGDSVGVLPEPLMASEDRGKQDNRTTHSSPGQERIMK